MTTSIGSERIEEAFRLRAAKLASKLDDSQERQEILGTFVVVSIGSGRFGVPIEALREISRAPVVTALPRLPAWILGVAMAGGQLVSVVDLGMLYGFAPATERPFLALIAGQQGELGVACDAVSEFRVVRVNEVKTGVSDPALGTSVPSRGTTLDLVTLLDIEVLFGDDRVCVKAEV